MHLFVGVAVGVVVEGQAPQVLFCYCCLSAVNYFIGIVPHLPPPALLNLLLHHHFLFLPGAPLGAHVPVPAATAAPVANVRGRGSSRGGVGAPVPRGGASAPRGGSSAPRGGGVAAATPAARPSTAPAVNPRVVDQHLFGLMVCGCASTVMFYKFAESTT